MHNWLAENRNREIIEDLQRQREQLLIRAMAGEAPREESRQELYRLNAAIEEAYIGGLEH